MYKCLKNGWIPLQQFEKENNITRWTAIKLSNKLDDDFKCKIGAVVFILKEEALKLI